MQPNNFGWTPNAQVLPQQTNKQPKPAKRSVGYEVLAKSLIYTHKEGSELKDSKWTPHNIRTLLITRKNVVVSKYSGSKDTQTIQLVAQQNITPDQAEYYTDMLDCLHTLDKGTQAKVKNIQDIIVVMGNTIGIPREAAVALCSSVNNIADKGITANVILLDESLSIPQVYNEILKEGKESLINSHIAGCGLSEVYLSQDSSKKWQVHTKRPNAQKEMATDKDGNQDNGTYTSFGLDNKLNNLNHIVTVGAALREYKKKHPEVGSKIIPKVQCAVKLNNLFTNTKDYPADDDLNTTLYKNYYKAAAVWEFLAKFEPVAVVEKKDISVAYEVGNVYDIAYNDCKQASSTSYRSKLASGMGQAIMTQMLTRRVDFYKSEKVASTTLISLVEKFLSKPDKEARVTVLEKEIKDDYREPFVQVLIEYVGYFASISCLLYLFGYGFRYSNQLAEFMFEDTVKPLASEGIRLLPEDALLYAIKHIVCQDTETQHSEAAIRGALETAREHLNATYLNTKAGEKYDITDIRKFANALKVLK